MKKQPCYVGLDLFHLAPIYRKEFSHKKNTFPIAIILILGLGQYPVCSAQLRPLSAYAQADLNFVCLHVVVKIYNFCFAFFNLLMLSNI